MTGDGGVLRSLDGKSSTLFLLAGGLLVVFGALLGVEAFVGTSAPEDVFGPPGFFLAMVGLLGLYPGLVDRAPRLVRVGAVLAAVSAVGWFLVTVLSIGEAAGVLPPASEMGPAGLTVILVAGVGMLLAYLTFGITGLRVGVPSRAVSLLMLAPPAFFGVMLAGVATGFTPLWSAFLIGSGQALAHLGIGYGLRNGGARTDRVEATTDSAA